MLTCAHEDGNRRLEEQKSAHGEPGNSPRLDLAAHSESPAHSPNFSRGRMTELFRTWETRRGILLAVSGGPDSVALMLLAAIWARGRALPFLHVATVDHGLRPESRSEAIAVARWAQAISLPHQILTWEGAKPTSRIQERAREARYDLLFGHAVEIGADCVATAHHADDQAETILFRLLRGSGVSGLAGMAPTSERHGVVLSRPLLQCRKEDLVSFCGATRHPFIDDPSNRNPMFARTRIRELIGHLAEQGLDRDGLLRLGRRAARAEAALAERAEKLRMALPACRAPGHFSADMTSLVDEPEEIFLRVLAREIKAVSNQPRFRLDRLERLAQDLHDALDAGVPFAATLSGALLRLRGDGTLRVSLEPARANRGHRTDTIVNSGANWI